MAKVTGLGTTAKPWALTTPPGTSEFEAYQDDEADPPTLVVQVGIPTIPEGAMPRRRLDRRRGSHGSTWAFFGFALEHRVFCRGSPLNRQRPRARSRFLLTPQTA